LIARDGVFALQRWLICAMAYIGRGITLPRGASAPDTRGLHASGDVA
jgi:hypothetical protein